MIPRGNVDPAASDKIVYLCEIERHNISESVSALEYPGNYSPHKDNFHLKYI